MLGKRFHQLQPPQTARAGTSRRRLGLPSWRCAPLHAAKTNFLLPKQLPYWELVKSTPPAPENTPLSNSPEVTLPPNCLPGFPIGLLG
eukprot:5990954-Amphidinium_carterae.1